MLRRFFVRPTFGTGITLLLWHGIPPPLQIARLRIARLEISGNIQIVTAHADKHSILDHNRRYAPVVELVEVAYLPVPSLLPVLQLEGNEVTIGSFEVQPVPIHADTAVAKVNTTSRFPNVMPDLAPCTRIHCPDVIRNREIQDAINQNRR